MMLLFISPNFVNTDFMTSPFKWCVEPGIHERKDNVLRQKPRAKDQHVGIIVPAGKTRLFDVLAKRRANAVHLVGRDRTPDPGIADPDRPMTFFAGHFFGGGKNKIRIIAGLVGKSTAVNNIEILVLKKINQRILQLNAAVIGRDCVLSL